MLPKLGQQWIQRFCLLVYELLEFIAKIHLITGRRSVIE